MKKQVVAILVFKDFETLDVFGPAEVFGVLKDEYQLEFYSEKGGLVSNYHGVSVPTKPIKDITKETDIFLIPGGLGTRTEVDNTTLLTYIKTIAEASTYVLTVCTGSALLAKTGLLNGKVATSNKRAFDWVITNGKKVKWKRTARWTVDGKYYTSSGVSAGMDMALGFISDRLGHDKAMEVANRIEYNWQQDKNKDNFADQKQHD